MSARAGRYVDKSGLIAVVNDTIGKDCKLSCISRARRFGKSYAAKMLCAYYDKSCDSSGLFDDLEIAKHPSYREHLNKYKIIYIDISNIIGKAGLENVVAFISDAIMREIMFIYPNYSMNKTLDEMLIAVVDKERDEENGYGQLVAIIDEWDVIIRDSDSTRRQRPMAVMTLTRFLRLRI